MVVVIKQVGSRYDVNVGDNRLHILNSRSLEYFLKHQLGLTKKQIKSFLVQIDKHGELAIQRDVA